VRAVVAKDRVVLQHTVGFIFQLFLCFVFCWRQGESDVLFSELWFVNMEKMTKITLASLKLIDHMSLSE
jgi:hypothetical protein